MSIKPLDKQQNKQAEGEDVNQTIGQAAEQTGRR